jgi:hypothetical protein
VKKSSKSESREPFVLGEDAFDAISAVEGLHLSEASRKRLSDMKKRGLSQDEQIAEVIRFYRAKAQSQH